MPCLQDRLCAIFTVNTVAGEQTQHVKQNEDRSVLRMWEMQSVFIGK